MAVVVVVMRGDEGVEVLGWRGLWSGGKVGGGGTNRLIVLVFM